MKCEGNLWELQNALMAVDIDKRKIRIVERKIRKVERKIRKVERKI